MCTVNVDDFDVCEADLLSTSTVKAVHEKELDLLCKKCRQESVRVSLKGKNGYCESCFLTMTTHKFRATIGKSKLVHQDDVILIGHSGKANSTVLLHLITSHPDESVTRKLLYRCKVLYIDDGVVKGYTAKERESIICSMAEQVKNLGLTGYVASLQKRTDENICDNIQPMDASRIEFISQDFDVQTIFGKLETDTAKDELLRRSRCKILVSAAKKLGCTKVFLADTSVDIAIKALGDISTGRGAQLAPDVAFSNTMCSDVTLLRPLREFTGEEVAKYMDCYHLKPIFSSQASFVPASIRNAAREFVCRLDNEFHSTVSTIYRTSDKLAGKSRPNKDTDDENGCVVCGTTIDKLSQTDEQLSAVQARIFSELASVGSNPSPYLPLNTVSNSSADERPNYTTCEQEKVVTDKKGNEKRCRCSNGTCVGSRSVIPPEEIDRYLCYGCKFIFSTSDSNSIANTLPAFMENAVQQRLRLTNMRKEITDFLL